MAGFIAKRPATYEDVLATPEGVRAEIVEGVLYTQPRPAAAHARAASSLGGELWAPFDRGKGGPGGWIFLIEPELHLGADILVPDLAAWRRERMPEVPATAFLTLAPDFVCEVLSPSTAFRDRRYKMPAYAMHQIPHLWFVDPQLRSIEVFRLDGQEYRVVAVCGHDEVVRLEPFDAIELELATMWIGQKPTVDGE
jgi:Uma2 family endonuclease